MTARPHFTIPSRPDLPRTFDVTVPRATLESTRPEDLSLLHAYAQAEVYGGSLELELEVWPGDPRWRMTADDSALTPTLAIALARGELRSALDDLNDRLPVGLDDLSVAPTFRGPRR